MAVHMSAGDRHKNIAFLHFPRVGTHPTAAGLRQRKQLSKRH
jgi:hypothetical protein